MFGFGAHLEPRNAVLRAITEMNQMLVPLTKYPDDQLPGFLSDPDTLQWLRTATVVEQYYLRPVNEPLIDIAEYQPVWTDDIREDVHLCQKNVERLGMEMLVLDPTREEIGMPVVKAIVPGLRHFWSRYAPGRLYDVPVKLGYFHEPLREVELNPIAMFL